jgi:hypothetical protein
VFQVPAKPDSGEAGAPETKASISLFPLAEEEHPSLADYIANGQQVAAAAEKTDATNASELLSELLSLGRRLDEVEIPKEILAVAEELVSWSDVEGLEHDSLLFLLRSVLFLDRRWRMNLTL